MFFIYAQSLCCTWPQALCCTFALKHFSEPSVDYGLFTVSVNRRVNLNKCLQGLRLTQQPIVDYVHVFSKSRNGSKSIGELFVL